MTPEHGRVGHGITLRPAAARTANTRGAPPRCVRARPERRGDGRRSCGGAVGRGTLALEMASLSVRAEAVAIEEMSRAHRRVGAATAVAGAIAAVVAPIIRVELSIVSLVGTMGVVIGALMVARARRTLARPSGVLLELDGAVASARRDDGSPLVQGEPVMARRSPTTSSWSWARTTAASCSSSSRSRLPIGPACSGIWATPGSWWRSTAPWDGTSRSRSRWCRPA